MSLHFLGWGNAMSMPWCQGQVWNEWVLMLQVWVGSTTAAFLKYSLGQSIESDLGSDFLRIILIPCGLERHRPSISQWSSSPKSQVARTIDVKHCMPLKQPFQAAPCWMELCGYELGPGQGCCTTFTTLLWSVLIWCSHLFRAVAWVGLFLSLTDLAPWM